MAVNVPYVPGAGLEAVPKPLTSPDHDVLPFDPMASSNHTPLKWALDPRETSKKAQSKS